jgi:hypothetical protein
MKRFVKLTLATLTALLALAAAPRSARADLSGYLCSAFEYPYSNSLYGNNGGIQLWMFSGPACTGSYVGSAIVPTANGSACPRSGWDVARLVSLESTLVAVATTGSKVVIGAAQVTPSGDGPNCVFGIYLEGR